MKFVPTVAIYLLLVQCCQADDRPNILFAFADDWGRYASKYAFTAKGRQFNRFSQFVTARAKNERNKIDRAKRELLDEVVGNFEDFLSKRDEGAPFCYWFWAYQCASKMDCRFGQEALGNRTFSSPG